MLKLCRMSKFKLSVTSVSECLTLLVGLKSHTAASLQLRHVVSIHTLYLVVFTVSGSLW